jgi:hypothetical protein
MTHVRVREVRGDPALVQEHLLELLVLREVRKDPLDHHQLREPTRAVQPPQEQLRHAAARELDQQLVTPDAVFSQRPHVSRC